MADGKLARVGEVVGNATARGKAAGAATCVIVAVYGYRTGRSLIWSTIVLAIGVARSAAVVK